VIESPPFDAGALQLTRTAPLVVGATVWMVGAPGGPKGVTAVEAADAELDPSRLLAVTVKV